MICLAMEYELGDERNSLIYDLKTSNSYTVTLFRLNNFTPCLKCSKETKKNK